MDNKITAELPHPEVMGGMLERGIRYGHHFVVELISDGKRLWAVASEEGRKILDDIEGKAAATQAAIESHVSHDDPLVLPLTTSGLELEGPTVAEWVEAGYSANNYPPAGYPSRSTQEEIDEAIKAEETSEALGKQSGSGAVLVTDQSSGLPSAAPTTTTSSANTFDS